MAKEQRILFTDTETTGLEREDQVIQIAALEVLHDEENPTHVRVVSEFECKFMPDDPDDPELGRYNSYDKEQWEEESISREKGIFAYFRLLSGKTFGGQNPKFDYGMIDEERRRLGISWPALAQYRVIAVENYSHVFSLLGYIESIKQEKVAAFLGLGAQTHDALDDVWQSVEIYRRLVWALVQGVTPDVVEAARGMPMLPRKR